MYNKLISDEILSKSKYFSIPLETINQHLWNYNDNIIMSCLMKDDLLELQKIYDPNQIKHQYISIKEIDEVLPILECAVVAKADKCFKFLIQNGSEINEDVCMKIIKYGTTFMADFCKDFLDYFECNFKTSIQYNNNSIADWTLSNCGFQKASLHCCVSNYNIQALIYFINHEIPFITKDSSNYVLFHSIYDLNLIKFFVGKGCELFKIDDEANLNNKSNSYF